MRGLDRLLCAAVLVLAAAGAGAATIGAGTFHSLAAKADGSVRAWGDDRFGALGAGRALEALRPVPVPGLSGVRTVSGGLAHTVALGNDGRVWTWGRNNFGQLGDGTTTDHFTPRPVQGLTGVVEIAAGGHHTLARKSDDTVWAWGLNNDGRLGDGTRTNRSSPVRIAVTDVVALAAAGWPPSGTGDGSGHSLALKGDGTVWAWGGNGSGQLGDGTTQTRLAPVHAAGIANAIAISAGYFHSAAVTRDGGAWTWGDNRTGQLGDGSTTSRSTPGRVPGLSGIVAVAAGVLHTLALRADGTAWSWGHNRYGALGDGTFTERLVPVMVASSSGLTAIAAGPYHSMALSGGGSVVAWGLNNHGQLGDDTNASRATPAPVSGLTGVVSISTGRGDPRETSGMSLAVRDDGTVWAWGDNGSGQLGDGRSLFRSTPTPVVTLTDMVSVAAGGFRAGVDLGGGHSVAVKRDGTVWAWGHNGFGQLGDGSSVARSTPARVPGLTGITAIAAGKFHTLALGNDRMIWAWGYNVSGQLGDGTSTNRSTPVRVSGIGDVVAVAAGSYHSLALRSDGTVWAWGSGDLGNGTRTSATPIRVSSLVDVVAIAAGDGHSAAVRRDGTLWTWGFNSHGQLGDGTHEARPLPVRVNLTEIAAASAGVRHTLALRRDGTVWVLGRDAGAEVDRPELPRQIAGLASVTEVSAGDFYSLATRSDGSVWAWGTNSVGQLGDGTFAGRSNPVVVVREEGGGSLAGNDWFLDLQPAIPTLIPAASVPALLVVASGTVSSEDVGVVANVRFRPQDIGNPIHVFAYVAAEALPGASKADACVLAQLDAAGQLVPVTAANLQSYLTAVTSSQGQAVSIVNNVRASQVAGATFCVGTGATGAQSTDPRNSACVVTVPGNVMCVPPSAPGFTADSPGALSGLWWNSGESGWGVSFTQRRNIVFAAWYTYDAAGEPKWFVASSCAMASAASSGTCSGSLYEVNGPRFFGAAFDPGAARVTTAGTLRVDFQDTNTASMTYTAAGQTRTVAIRRQMFQSGGPAPAVDYTDLWWNPSESGWGLSVTHQSGVMFLAWYVYDAAGRPMWYVASNCAVSGSGCAGTLYRTRGPAFGSTFDPAQVRAFEAGSVSLAFTDPNTGILTYTVDGVTASKALTRQLF